MRTEMTEPVLQDLFNWIDETPSPYHAASNACARLADSGFTLRQPEEHWNDLEKVVVKWGGTVIAAAFSPKINPDFLRFRIVGAHTDSPNLRIKPKPEFGSAGYQPVSYTHLTLPTIYSV